MPWPLNVNAPLVGRLFSVSILVWIQLPPNEIWWLPEQQVDVVGDLVAVGVEVARIGAAVADREAVAGDVDADIARSAG